ncbi:putative ubiquitin hydrolase [Trypanosoma conorhini]|uniref:Ubiquitin carboxyl-terminal hydrolase n=1 Tax=Trypanosoma conorhini TaxID=83891 RepID=A0A422Q976_9TRYP|nr:putative ubiquitin hydrolase [Trypanosoma conorhini]RNF26490.1 putative ubiquitin hydrolase [Trypanosoma conorhini]
MEVVGGSNGFVGRNVVFRPIHFERYRKPAVVSYPRHAVVLNPHHTREAAREVRAHDHADEASSGESEASGNGDADADDDDPLRLEEELMLCRNAQLRHLLHLRWREVGPSGCGLLNMGNTCFVNSVLQAVAYTPALAQYFAGNFKTPCSHAVGASYDYAYALGETVRKIHTPSNRPYRAGLIVSHLKSLSPHFRPGRQGDAHEFAVHLLHACHRSILFRQVGSRKVSPHIEQTNALQRIIGGYLRSVVAWSRQEEIHRLAKAGKVQEAADLKLSGRGHSSDALVSNTYDPFITLSVEVVGQTLHHCLAKLCQEERLDGHSYISPRGVGVRATKRFQLHKLPPVLIIHMKRFNCMGAKISRHVQYPKQLNLVPFCTAEGIAKAAARRAAGEDAQEHSCLYELNAICIHEGNSLAYGHYCSVVRSRNGMWLLCDDESVSYCDEERALRQQAYMLFYSRIEPPSSGAVRTRKEDTRASQLLSRRHTTTTTEAAWTLTTSMLSESVREGAEKEDVGRPLSEAEVARVMQEKAAATRQQLLEAARKEQPPHHGHSNGRRETSPAASSASPDENDEARQLRRGVDAAKGIVASLPATAKQELPASQNGHCSSRYGGIIKAIRRTAPPALVAAAATRAETPAAGDTAETQQEADAVVGPKAAAVVQGMKQQSVPGTVARPRHAPKFRQQVRDPMWESEMDRGRLKRVRARREEYVGENKFQKAEIAFDSRGRRHRGA